MLKNYRELSSVINFKEEYKDKNITPTERYDGIWFKRDDKFEIADCYGGKARTCWYLSQNTKGLITAGSRQSPQVNIVAHIAQKLKIPCRLHVPSGKLTPELLDAQNCGAQIIQHRPGYNSVIIKRAKDDALKQQWKLIPFGMECYEAVTETSYQVQNIPKEVKRIVVPVGSGMSLAGILFGLIKYKKNIPVVGICVGANPIKRLNKFAPQNWENMVKLIKLDIDYRKHIKETNFHGITLDSIYEAKCIPYIKKGDLFWIVGIRTSQNIKESKNEKI